MDYTNENIDEATRMKLCSIEEHFINMRASGQTIREIARKLKKSDHTISDLNKKYFRRVKELQKEKLEVLQKKMFEQKQSRLDFFTEQLLIVKNEIANKKISLNYEELVILSIKISTALNKCERDMLINDLLGSKENISTDVSIPPNPVEDPPRRATNGAGNNSHNLSKNNEVTSEIKNPGNTATKNKKSKESQKTDDNSKKKNSEYIKKESKPKENKQKVYKHEEKKPKESKQEDNKQDKNMNADLPPRTRADFYRRVLKNNTKAPT
jgi:hypothetical protein